jgi:hypothetical protein
MAGLGAIEVLLRDRNNLDAIAARAEASGVEPEHSAGALVLRDPWDTQVLLR